MDNTSLIKRQKIIKGLLRQRETKKRRKLMLIYALVAILCVVGINSCYYLHVSFYPIIEVFLGVIMVFCLYSIILLRQFPMVAELIDWEKMEAAGQKKEERA